MKILAILAMIVLVSCGAPRAVFPPTPPPDTCNAAQYQNLIGQDPSAAQAVPQPKRVFHITDLVTTDHRPDRLNVQIDDTGTIGAITCG